MSNILLSLNRHVATLQNGSVQIKVDVSHGARIISFSHQDVEILTQPTDHAENFGSTMWDAPQSRWKWPPPTALDSEPYAEHVAGDVLECTSAVDRASGLQFWKRIRPLPTAAVEIEYGIKNAGPLPITTAAWEITRTPAGLTFVPATQLAVAAESTLPAIQFTDNHAWYTVDPAPLEIGKKAFFDVSAGWLAHVTPNRQLFIKSFAPLKPKQYSPGHAAVEVYAHIAGAYVELENHGPRTTLQPGQSLKYAVRWFAQSIPDDMVVKIGNQVLIDLAQEILDTEKS